MHDYSSVKLKVEIEIAEKKQWNKSEIAQHCELTIEHACTTFKMYVTLEIVTDGFLFRHNKYGWEILFCFGNNFVLDYVLDRPQRIMLE